MPFQVVWGRSYCRAMEKLVDILSEYPHEMQYMFSPSCVPLLRCTGCCGDEALHCVPVETTNVTMQVGRVSSRPACPLAHPLFRGSQRLLPEGTWRGKEGRPRSQGCSDSQALSTQHSAPPFGACIPTVGPLTSSLISSPSSSLAPLQVRGHPVGAGKDLNLLRLKKSLFIPGVLGALNP